MLSCFGEMVALALLTFLTLFHLSFFFLLYLFEHLRGTPAQVLSILLGGDLDVCSCVSFCLFGHLLFSLFFEFLLPLHSFVVFDLLLSGLLPFDFLTALTSQSLAIFVIFPFHLY